MVAKPDISDAGKRHGDLEALRGCTNDLIPAANACDLEQIKAAAATVGEAMAVDVDAIRATMFDQAIGAGG